MTRKTGDLAKRIQREAIVRAATSTFFDWTSAIIIALVIMLTAFNVQPFDWWQRWFWVLGGVLAEVALIAVSLTDPEHWRKVTQDHLEREYNPADIKSKRSRQRLEKALMYRAQMEELLHSLSGAMRTNLEQAAEEMEKGIAAMYTLGCRLDGLMNNEIIKRDLQVVPQAVEHTQKRLQTEQNPSVRAELEQTLEAWQTQLDNLKQIETRMTRADIQIDNMLASIGAAYTQMQLIDATKGIDSSRIRHLREDVAEQVEKTQDVIYAMDEVYQQSSTM